MPHFRFLAALLLGRALAWSDNTAAFAGILIQIDKRAQTMTGAVDGQLRYRWPVSTGATGFSTPAGSYTPFRIEVWHTGLGTPVSHGCVRLTLSNATTLYQLVQANGMSQTKVVVRGPDPLGVTVPSQPPRQRARVWRPFQFFQF